MLKDSLITYKAMFQYEANNKKFLASKAMSILAEFEKSFDGNKINYSQFYDALNYNSWTFGQSNFSIAQIKDDENDLNIHLKFNTFLKQLKIHKEETNNDIKKFLNFLEEYRQESLEPGILKYKNNLLLIPDPQSLKNSLKQLLITFNNLTSSEISQYRQLKTNEIDEKYSVTELLGAGLAKTATNAYSKHVLKAHQNDDFKFLYQLRNIIDKSDLNYSDIAQLKNSSQQFEKSISKLKSISAITRFHWILNMLCDFLNIFADCFESNKSLKIKQNFRFWHQCLKFSESNVAIVENRITNIR